MIFHRLLGTLLPDIYNRQSRKIIQELRLHLISKLKNVEKIYSIINSKVKLLNMVYQTLLAQKKMTMNFKEIFIEQKWDMLKSNFGNARILLSRKCFLMSLVPIQLILMIILGANSLVLLLLTAYLWVKIIKILFSIL
jgi:hypothetical protein